MIGGRQLEASHGKMNDNAHAHAPLTCSVALQPQQQHASIPHGAAAVGLLSTEATTRHLAEPVAYPLLAAEPPAE
jgi:hypothetical protein